MAVVSLFLCANTSIAAPVDQNPSVSTTTIQQCSGRIRAFIKTDRPVIIRTADEQARWDAISMTKEEMDAMDNRIRNSELAIWDAE
jgi:hypothetical protein